LISTEGYHHLGIRDVCAAFAVLHTYAVCPFGGRHLKLVIMEEFPAGGLTHWASRIRQAHRGHIRPSVRRKIQSRRFNPRLAT